jgi:cell division protein FtsW
MTGRQGDGMKKAKDPSARTDFIIMIVVVILTLFGCVMVYSASFYDASINHGGDGAFYFKKQLIGACLGLLSMLLFMRFDYRRLESMKWIVMGVAFVLLLMVFLPKPIGITLNGSKRWVNIGITTLQPAELAKFAIVIYLAAFFAQNRHRLSSFREGVVPVIIVVGLCCGLILLQPNFSMIICIALLTAVMMFAGGVRKRHLIALGSVGLAGVVAAIVMAPYRLRRVFAFLDPWSDPTQSSYQLVQSFYAIGSGGLFGKGLGRSQQKLLYLPYSESDFIASIIAEELGFIGMLLLFALYLVLIWRGIRIALTCPNRFGSLLATGIIAMIAIQVVINIAVVTGSMPPTGQTLPFISYGTSSLIIFMSSMGVLLNISKNSAVT